MEIKGRGHDKFMSSKNLPKDSESLRIYLLLHGLEYWCKSKGIELPFEIDDLDKEVGDFGRLDDA